MRKLLPGSAEALGANWDGEGVNFALFSANATRVELCLFDQHGSQELERLELPAKTDDVWHGYLPGCRPGTIYGYRVYGPYQPETGHRFNHHKLLLDPYARQLYGKLEWCDAVFGYDPQHADGDLSFNSLDSASHVPKAVVVDESFDWQGDQPPDIPWSETIIYEAHVRGFTKLHPEIAEARRGSFAALASNEVIDYLKSLGTTSIELQPVHAFVDDFFLIEKNLKNYWGYNSLSFFAAEARYLSSGSRDEFKSMVRDLHRAGIEVILDVVYNHTAEGDQIGPTLSFRGIDNASYYRLPEDNQRAYINDSGCGNTLNSNHPRVLQMVIDSLRHWVVDMHVDGFRFDLAVSLGREPQGFNNHSAFFKEIQADAVLSKVKLIAEPWDIGPGGYQLGAFPPDWAEWNDKFRDSTRRFWRGDTVLLPDFARSLHGYSELFEHNGRLPSASINLVTSHDGFTLNDLVSYSRRHNEANGESNQDGHNANFSHNYGAEGLSNDPIIISRRRRQQRNFLATLLLAHGTPMLLAGDEIGRSQQGNNNAYCQDNPLTWLDWSLVEKNGDLLKTVQQLMQLRKKYTVLQRDEFLHDHRINWLSEDGLAMTETDWHDPHRKFIALLLNGNDTNRQVNNASLILAFNAASSPLVFTYPNSQHRWHCVFSTANGDQSNTTSTTLTIEPHSVYVIESRELESNQQRV